MSAPADPIVILGGGFAGVYAARHLQRRLPRGHDLVLFSQENHLVFTPLLGNVVGSSINPMHVVQPVRQMVRRTNCRTAFHVQFPTGMPASRGVSEPPQ